jgi:N-acetyl-anhydromuramyl-L-alanine amidase AmpD
VVNTLTNLTTQYQSGRDRGITLIGIHTMEAPENENVAMAVANYFKTVQASSHWCVDDKTRVRVVYDEDTAWTMPPTNSYSLNVEMAGYAAQSTHEWGDNYSQGTLDNAALCVAEWCKKYDIPVRHLSDAQIAAGDKGLAGHVDVNRVFRDGDHTDPGPNFPWAAFLNRVNAHLKALGGKVTPVEVKPNCISFQEAIRTKPDNSWGADTDEHATALIAATAFGGYTFPYGIPATQAVVGVTQDGIWGPKSKAALASTVRTVQNCLKAMGFNPGTVDGDWGVNTNKAYVAARNACHD